MSSISEALDFLTPGSVFVNKKGRVAKLLFLTNTSLVATAPEHIQKEHPVQVVYANEDGEVFNRDLDDFISKYKFYNVDPDLEARLDNLLIFTEDDPAHEALADQEDAKWLEKANAARKEGFASKADVDALTSRAGLENVNKSSVVDTVPASDPMWTPTQTNKIVADALSVGDDDDEDDGLLLPPQYAAEEQNSQENLRASTAAVSLTFSTHSGLEFMTGVRAKLSSALVAYGQEPDITQGLIIHRLTFALDNELTISLLQDLFRPREDEHDPRFTIDVFDVRTAHSIDSIVWTSYIGVFPDYNKSGLYATVMVGTDEVRAMINPEVENSLSESISVEFTETVQTVVDALSQIPVETPTSVDVDANENTTPPQNPNIVDRSMIHVEVGNSEYVPTPKDISDLTQRFQNASIPDVSQQAQGIHIHPSIDQLFTKPDTDVPGAL